MNCSYHITVQSVVAGILYEKLMIIEVKRASLEFIKSGAGINAVSLNKAQLGN